MEIEQFVSVEDLKDSTESFGPVMYGTGVRA